jgi:alpha-beta hydrolase superfamily lysophospholipase
MDLITLALAKKYTEKRVAEISGEGPSGVQADWAEMDETAASYIKNKPELDTMVEEANSYADKIVDELKIQAAFISDSNENIAVNTEENSSKYAGTIHRFTVEINCAPMYVPEDNLGPEFTDDYQPYTDYGVLVFPNSYTDRGKKTRLVISAHGGGGKVDATSSQAEYQSISRYLVANGYAVMDVNGLPEQYAIDKGNLRIQDSVGSYLAIQSYIKAYNYCMDNFNFYPEVFLVGISEGGITTTNIVLHTHIPVLAQAGWSPVLDTYNQIWMDPWPWYSVNGPGAVLATVYGFDPIPDATSTKDRLRWTYDEKKLMGYNPMKCNVVTGADGLEYRYYRCPVKFWHCMDDETVRYEPTEAFIKSIQNAGGTAYLKLYETGGHETAYVGEPVPNPIGNTIAYDGTEIEIKPVCEETFLFFKRFE